MGIPKFFRWAAERYPMIITPFKNSPPPIDNLYLDMNGIIHHCTHPNDIDATRKAPTEKEMVEAMFSYLEKLFNAIQPRKYFLLAVDGCAPRAKMNQQRQRRYRSGYEMMKAREEALKIGEDVPDEGDVFDSNSITPGTEFMVRLSEQFEYFISMKVQTDSAWRNCTVIFSGQNHPGEGEHKIVDFIRRRKTQPDYNPNETHCMYGLDADLMMLALATHEPHFCLLREVVSFGPRMSKRDEARHNEDKEKGVIEDPTLAKPDSFVLLHVSLFREYLDLDIRRGDDLPNYDMERMIDDFVLMCFLVGNDFLPAIPTLAINDGAMTTMLNIYRSHIASKGYNLVKNNKPNWPAIEAFLTQLGHGELDTLRARREEELEYQKRQARKDDSGVVPVPPVPITNMTDYKKRYYGEKLAMGSFEAGSHEMSALRQHYIEGLSWVFEYYYNGPPSWKWYFPHHYAPLASDLVNLASVADRVKFELGEPFLPHQQLLAVLPPMSHRSMPKAYWNLLTSPSSPLHKYFPKQLMIDKEGARNPWEGIVLIPFIDEDELRDAYQSVQHKLTDTDKLRNRNGKPILFKFDPTVQPYDVPNSMFETLRKVTVRRNTIEFPTMNTPSGRFIPRLCPGVKLHDEVMEGFPSLESFVLAGNQLVPAHEPNVVNIFGQTSKKESLILYIDDSAQPHGGDAAKLAHLVGKKVWVGIPHLKRARVASVVDRRQRITAKYNEDGVCLGVASQDITNDEFRIFKRESDVHQEMLKGKCGVALPQVDVLVFVNRFLGLKLTRRGRFVQVFSDKETCYPIQLVADQELLPVDEDDKNTERERLPVDADNGAKAIYIGPDPPNHRGRPLLGSTGVARVSEDRKSHDMVINYKAKMVQLPDIVLDAVRNENWLPLGAVCARVSSRLRFSVSPGTITSLASSLITSSAYGHVDLGLCIKFTGKNLARVGYARLLQTQYNAWYVGGGAALFEKMEDDVEEGYHMSNKGGINGQPRSLPAGRGRGAGGPPAVASLDHRRGEQSSSNQSGRGIWQFSTKSVELITEYCERFSPLVERLEAGRTNSANFDVSSVLRGPWADRDAGDVVKEIATWIEQTGIQKKPMVHANEETITAEQFASLEAALVKTPNEQPQQLHMTNVQQKYIHFPSATVREGFTVAVPLPKEQKITLCTRVVYCRSTGNVPFGMTGTVARLLGDNATAEVVFDEPFVGGATLAGRLKAARGALVPLQSLLVIQAPDVHSKSSAAKAAIEQGGIDVSTVLDKLNAASRDKVQQPAAGASLALPPPRSSGKPVVQSGPAPTGPAILDIDNAPSLPTEVEMNIAGGVDSGNVVANLNRIAPTKNVRRITLTNNNNSNAAPRSFIQFAAPSADQSIDKVIKGRLSQALGEIFNGVGGDGSSSASAPAASSGAKITLLKK